MEGTNGQADGKFSLADASVARSVRAWLAVVAKHVGCGEFVEEVTAGLFWMY